jgi:hypothetical protein
MVIKYDDFQYLYIYFPRPSIGTQYLGQTLGSSIGPSIWVRDEGPEWNGDTEGVLVILKYIFRTGDIFDSVFPFEMRFRDG